MNRTNDNGDLGSIDIDITVYIIVLQTSTVYDVSDLGRTDDNIFKTLYQRRNSEIGSVLLKIFGKK